MPRWRALPEELDPQVREFASQLRRLVDRSGLSIAAVADRTGYSKTSWERYLNGRLLAPKGAIVALAEVTGTNPMHLTTMWELAERAWSRSEMRHDMTMEAIRISQARAALGEFGPNPPGGRNGKSRGAAPAAAHPPTQPASTYSQRPAAGSGAGAHSRPPSGPRGPQRPAPSRGGSPDGQRRKRKLTMFLAGVVGALVVIAAAVFLTDFGKDDGGNQGTDKPPATPTTSDSKLPDGVECSGESCAGKDPEEMGCGGTLATSPPVDVAVGAAKVEVRYSKTCGAAWGRITSAGPGDTVEIRVKGQETQTAKVNGDFDAYTPMIPVKNVEDAKACATLTDGQEGCTK
ncbi:helix-turn-helix domain-containing protein [Streptomyces indicus]|uniref:Helix-turn-helix domain-containing protein n=1 Tax=Streptomyces indicus TaxID=417292 RepID=A0A1G9EG85_9ACTN|nr:XRE family transcriptional regulator [Streptomyces indicus]SDK75170.1 Helix-turn-helix domain-containing protein [Streptomyces indicus]